MAYYIVKSAELKQCGEWREEEDDEIVMVVGSDKAKQRVEIEIANETERKV